MMKKKSLLFRLFAIVACLLCSMTAKAAVEAYAVFTRADSTLTFYYDDLRDTRPEITYSLNTSGGFPDWYYWYVKHAVFDPSFANARPTTTISWFDSQNELLSISGLNYLNTSEVKNMSYMFAHCSRLTSLDVSNFNTAKVTNMRYMFYACTHLTSLDVSNFNTVKVTDMSNMFYGCYSLMTIYAGDGWSTAAVTYSTNMFVNCTSLMGGEGTTYNANYVDKAYAHIDGGPSNPGYFTEKPAGMRGDVNGDGDISIADVTSLIDYLLVGDVSLINLTGADTDLNGEVSIADVTFLIDYLLVGTW